MSKRKPQKHVLTPQVPDAIQGPVSELLRCMKVSFGSEDAAQQMHPWQHVYLCPQCKKWHTATNEPRARRQGHRRER